MLVLRSFLILFLYSFIFSLERENETKEFKTFRCGFLFCGTEKPKSSVAHTQSTLIVELRPKFSSLLLQITIAYANALTNDFSRWLKVTQSQ